MKVHKMSNKQFAKFVSDLQKQAMKNPLRLSFGGTEQYSIWASHDPHVKLWYVREGDITYTYLDSDLEKAVQNG